MAERTMGAQIRTWMDDVTRFVEASVDGIARDYAAEAVEAIRERTRAGFGVAKDGASSQPLEKLSRKYVRYRQLNSRLLSPQTSAGMSNLTFTGKLLDKLNYKRESKGVWTIQPSSDRTKIAGWVSKARPFLFLSSAEIKRLDRRAQQRFDALAKRKGFS